jgi:hypothetical protein
MLEKIFTIGLIFDVIITLIYNIFNIPVSGLNILMVIVGYKVLNNNKIEYYNIYLVFSVLNIVNIIVVILYSIYFSLNLVSLYDKKIVIALYILYILIIIKGICMFIIAHILKTSLQNNPYKNVNGAGVA